MSKKCDHPDLKQDAHPGPWTVMEAKSGCHGILDVCGMVVALLSDLDTAKDLVDLASAIHDRISTNESLATKKANYVTEVSVIDPDTKAPVEVSLYKDQVSGGIFGVDSSYLVTLSNEDPVIEPFNGNYVCLIDGAYGMKGEDHASADG